MKSMDNPCSDCVKSLCPENKDEPSANILEIDLIFFVNRKYILRK